MISAEDISVSVRMLVLWCGYCYFSLNFMGRILGRIRSYFIILTELIIKGFALNIVCGILLQKVYGQQMWWMISYSMLTIFYSITIFWIHDYTYYGSFLKVNLASACAEINYMILSSLPMCVLNVLEKRKEVFAYSVGFHPLDLLFPVLIAVIFEMEYYLLKPWIPEIRRFEPKQRKIGWIVMSGYVTIGFFSTIQGLEMPERADKIIYIPALVMGMLILTGLILLTAGYRKSVLHKRKFLKAQQEMMRLHHDVILRQSEELEENRREIEQQMKSLIVSDAGRISEGRIRQYLTVLTGQYEQIRAGVYCRDMLTDAVLYHMAVRFRQRNLPFEFSFQEYDRGNIEEADIAEFLMNVQKTAETEGIQKISLKAGCVKDVLIFELTGPAFRELRRLKKQMFPVATKYSGDIWIQKESSTLCLRLGKGKREAEGK